jgi:hypothetical protein
VGRKRRAPISEPLNRRAALSAFAGVPALAVLPAVAIAIPPAASPPLSKAVALAIAAHKAAQAEIDAMPSQPDEHAFDAACDLEAEALEAVAETPCESDADFFAKATYLIERERKAWGTKLSDCAHFGLLALATELHMKGPDALEVGDRADV